MEAYNTICENFLRFFIDKVSFTRALISPPAYDPSISVPCSAVFNQFEPVTLSFLQEIIVHFKPSNSPGDAVPPRLFKEVSPTIGPSVTTVIVRKILSKLGSESLDMINTKPLFLARKRQVRTTCQEAGSELSDSQNGAIAIYIVYVCWPHNVMGKERY